MHLNPILKNPIICDFFFTELAYLLISGLLLNSKNYKEAVDILKERFGNKQVLIFSYMDSFEQLPVAKNSIDEINLQKLYDKIEISVRNFNSLGVRLPEELRSYLIRKFKNNLWNIDDLSRSSHPEVFCKKRVLRNFTKFTGKYLCQSLLFKVGISNSKKTFF